MKTTSFGNDNPQEFPVGTILQQGRRTAVVVSVSLANKTYGLYMATVRWDDDGTLLSLPFSNVRREFVREPHAL